MNFLNAEWVDLILANYVVEPEILNKFVPEKTTLDYHENKCYLSLVAFMFRQTRILGCPIPYHSNFEEVNLRFYVKPNYDYSERSVTFIKEIVPLKTIPFVANNFLKENYVALPMSHKISHPNISYLSTTSEKSTKLKKVRCHALRPRYVALPQITGLIV